MVLKSWLVDAGHAIRVINRLDLGVSMDIKVKEWGFQVSAFKEGDNGTCCGKFKGLCWDQIEEVYEEEGENPLLGAISELVKWGFGKDD